MHVSVFDREYDRHIERGHSNTGLEQVSLEASMSFTTISKIKAQKYDE